ncbi:MAG: helix-turn-helix domain-containing protein, partial [Gemmatimonadales bacterium]|nr:helix-turn-helix domain-containing protein [Gemmatimonadales bacterium]
MTDLMERTMTETTDQERWEAVLGRDSARDGEFVYGVSSTGVYCRPSCPARRPGRERVRFFAKPADARTAGFRACRRCGPDDAPANMLQVARARDYLDLHPDEPVTLERLAQEVGMSPGHLQRTFKRITGLSPRAYTASVRLSRLKAGLRDGDSVSRATYGAGYNSASRVYDEAAPALGMTPAAYRRGGRGVGIRYTVTPTPFGDLLVAATERGLCAVTLGHGATLETDLRREFPEASVERDDDGMAGWAAAIGALVTTGTPAELPMDVPGTAFQWQVWDALRRLPRGRTTSYG